MSIDNLVNKADEKILQGCQYIAKKSNEYLGTNKYDLARLCDGIGALGWLYMGVGNFLGPANPNTNNRFYNNLMLPLFGLNAVVNYHGFRPYGTQPVASREGFSSYN